MHLYLTQNSIWMHDDSCVRHTVAYCEGVATACGPQVPLEAVVYILGHVYVLVMLCPLCACGCFSVRILFALCGLCPALPSGLQRLAQALCDE